ncbi:hypothetical protein CCB80_00465 [Armatimonadetes bacterium Uphvl-Ar1]|nr:hypothetical protein CCB80_00465 [Armatimonadetes bacterium Uphvl-Ar1]
MSEYSSAMSSGLESLKSRLAKVNALNSAIALMDWDQQCLMPSGGADARGEHVGILSGMAHEMFVSEETQRALENAEKEVIGGMMMIRRWCGWCAVTWILRRNCRRR